MVNQSIINQSIIDSMNIIFGLHVPLIYVFTCAKYKKNSLDSFWDISPNVPIVDGPQTTYHRPQTTDHRPQTHFDNISSAWAMLKAELKIGPRAL